MARGRKSSLRLVLSAEEHHTWERWPRATPLAAGLVRRGKSMLLWAAGHSPSDGAAAVGVPRTVVRKGARRFLAQRLEGLADAPGRGAKGSSPPEVAIHVVRVACERPAGFGRRLSHWDGAELARQLLADGLVTDISAATIRRLLAAHPLQPWRHHLWLDPRPPRDAEL